MLDIANQIKFVCTCKAIFAQTDVCWEFNLGALGTSFLIAHFIGCTSAHWVRSTHFIGVLSAPLTCYHAFHWASFSVQCSTQLHWLESQFQPVHKATIMAAFQIMPRQVAAFFQLLLESFSESSDSDAINFLTSQERNIIPKMRKWIEEMVRNRVKWRDTSDLTYIRQVARFALETWNTFHWGQRQ